MKNKTFKVKVIKGNSFPERQLIGKIVEVFPMGDSLYRIFSGKFIGQDVFVSNCEPVLNHIIKNI